MRLRIRSWSKPWYALRKSLGLPRSAGSPLFEGSHSPHGVLALFSSVLGVPRPDWAPNTLITGFPFQDDIESSKLDDALVHFLDDGPPPIVFTLGSSAVLDAGSFYDEAAEAARRLGVRAVLLVGDNPKNQPRKLPAGVITARYAPFSAIFQRASVIVHQGGVGTTGQALRAGRPMIVTPHAYDQPDNGRRVANLGVARVVTREEFRAERLVREIGQLLEASSFKDTAARLAARITREDGVRTACDALETILRHGSLRQHDLSA